MMWPLKVVFIFSTTLCLTIGYILLSYGTYGTSFDEMDQIKIGGNTLKYYKSGLRDKAYFETFNKQVLATRYTLTDMYAKVWMQATNNNNIENYHLALGLFSIPIFVCTPLIIAILTKSPKWALFTWVSTLSVSRLSGDIFNNSKDVPFATFTAILLLVMVALMYKRRTNIWHLILVGIILGILAAIRLGLLVIMILPTLWFLQSRINRKTLFVMIIGLLAAWFWQTPILHGNILQGTLLTIKEFTNFKEIGLTLFQGNMIMSNNLPAYYLPLYFLITLPEYILLSLFLFIFSSDIPARIKMVSNYSLIIIGLFVTFTVLIRPNIYDGWRHFNFLAIFWIIIGTLGIYLSKNIFRSILLICYLINIVTIVQLYPYQYVYFNKFLGGLKQAEGRFETEYWGTSFKETALWLNANAYEYFSNKPYVYSCVPHLLSLYLNKDITLLNSKPAHKYLYVCFSRLSKLNDVDGKILYEVKREDVVLNSVKLVDPYLVIK